MQRFSLSPSRFPVPIQCPTTELHSPQSVRSRHRRLCRRRAATSSRPACCCCCCSLPASPSMPMEQKCPTLLLRRRLHRHVCCCAASERVRYAASCRQPLSPNRKRKRPPSRSGSRSVPAAPESKPVAATATLPVRTRATPRADSRQLCPLSFRASRQAISSTARLLPAAAARPASLLVVVACPVPVSSTWPNCSVWTSRSVWTWLSICSLLRLSTRH